MQAELDAEPQAGRVEIRVAGINAVGLEFGNGGISQGRTIPWLQDVMDQNVWGTWRVNELRATAPGVVYRDVILLQGDNKPFAVYNLTEHDLGVPANYDYLKNLLRTAATQ
jgi:hypothetical protein